MRAAAILLLASPAVCNLFAASGALAVINAGVESSEDAPVVSTDYQFLPGDYLYCVFEISGFEVKPGRPDEPGTISLSYEVTPEDSRGTPLAPAASGEIQTQLNPEDKNWIPKRRASFLLPSFVAAGQYKLRFQATDRVSGHETSLDVPFQIGGIHISPSTSIIVENFRLFRGENDRQALETPAYQPGDTIYARFDMTGYALAPDHAYHLAYGLTVFRPDGKPFLQSPNAAELASKEFYPPQFVTGAVEVLTKPDSARGTYVLVLTVRDLLGNHSYEVKKAFTLE